MIAPIEGRIVVLAKSPRPGRVKTRLCPPCTPEQAAALAEAALRDTMDAVAHTGAARRVLVLDGPTPGWVGERIEVIPQRGGGLDARLAGAFRDAGAPALLIGMDTPQVTPELLERSLEALLAPGTDAVLGPATDGGWWAIGLRRADAAVFLGVPMSTSRSGRAQAARLDLLGLRWTALPALADVDDFDGATAVAQEVPGSRFSVAVGDVEAALRVTT